MGGSLLVGLSLGVVLVLGSLVGDSVTGCLETVEGVSKRIVMAIGDDWGSGGSSPSADSGVVVLRDLLVGLLGSTAGGGLNLVSDVVAGVLDGIHVDCLVWLGVLLSGCVFCFVKILMF